MTETHSTGNITDRLTAVRLRMARAARSAGRDPSTVTLIAVSKTFEAGEIEPALVAGQRVFGENRVQEAKGKWPGLRQRYGDVELHLIGPLQTNKVREAIALFDVIHVVDRAKLAEEIAREVTRQQRRPRLFVQVNTGDEPQKAGIPPGDVRAFVGDCRERLGLSIDGLMCIPPVDEEPALHFGLLRNHAKALGLASLSMGMSADYETAIELGATHVRVGSAIFGIRDGH